MNSCTPPPAWITELDRCRSRFGPRGNSPFHVVLPSTSNPKYRIHQLTMMKNRATMRLVPVEENCPWLRCFPQPGRFVCPRTRFGWPNPGNLDAWELNRLESADAAWVKAQERAEKSKKKAKDLYSAANAAYQLFIEEFRSPAVAYACFGQGVHFTSIISAIRRGRFIRISSNFSPIKRFMPPQPCGLKEKLTKKMATMMMPSAPGLKLPKMMPTGCNCSPLMHY